MPAYFFVIDDPTPERCAAVRNWFESKLNNKRRRIQFNIGRLCNIQRELAILEAAPLPRPKVISPTSRNPFGVVDISDQITAITERGERIAQLKAKIAEVNETIRVLEHEEKELQTWVDQNPYFQI